LSPSSPTNHDPADPRAVLKEYNIGMVSDLLAAGGTAGRTWKVTTSTGDYFLRLRGVRTSSEPRLQFDHGLREHLVARGIPTASAVRTKGGARWLRREGRVFELYPFVAGRPFCPGNVEEIGNAAVALGRFHEAARDYEVPQGESESIGQYTTLGFSTETSHRMDDPAMQRLNLASVRELAVTSEDERVMDWCLGRVGQLEQDYGEAVYERLFGWVIHGDYTPANLLFSDEGEVVGVFDLDWALPGTRCRDIAEGMFFFGAEPRGVDSGDIWSLTAAPDLSRDRCAAFLKAYHGALPLSAEELDAIPSAVAGFWFSIRLEGLAKVPEEDRFRFFAREIERPLAWLDRNWTELRGRL